MSLRSAITIENLSIGYLRRHNSKRVAEGLTATVRSGRLSCLLGENGVGKSTLLRTLSGFQPPLNGSIRLMGRPLESYSIKEFSHTLAVVLTEKCDLTNMTSRELVSMGRSPYTDFWGRLGRDDRRIVDEAIECVGISQLAERKVQTLSDGERQKVMIAKAIAQQTPLIFLDEPTAYLDFPSKVEIMQLLHRLTLETGRTIFLSTHDVELALQLADYIWILRRSEGLQTGTPEDLSLDGTLLRLFPDRGVRFDVERGVFRIDHRLTGKVVLRGDGAARLMAAKALRRVGFDPEAREAQLTVEAAEHMYRLHCGDRTEEFPTIGDMLEALKENDFSASGPQRYFIAEDIDPKA